ncbi:hypothetical protein AYX07_00670 [Thermoactinomyces sp. AS95]|nr:hypothetical protein JS81_14935 [Thermoactinomyces sp. Gus2-1]KYQ87253.1 hypothetical protein AYX07_00670 [Thermoactinomyces sp. AS95]
MIRKNKSPIFYLPFFLFNISIFECFAFACGFYPLLLVSRFFPIPPLCVPAPGMIAFFPVRRAGMDPVEITFV